MIRTNTLFFITAALMAACTQTGDSWVTSLDSSDANGGTSFSMDDLECGTPGWNDISPIYAKACFPCHTASISGGTQFGSVYEDNLAESNACSENNIAECNIIRIEEGTMPMGKDCGGPVADDAENNDECVTESELEALKAWVDSGIQNDPCSGLVEETPVWADVALIYDKACSPCHTTGTSGDTQFGSVYEDNLAESLACSGETIAECSIFRIEAGTMPMGRGCDGAVEDDAVNADECVTKSELQTLKAWVDNGSEEERTPAEGGSGWASIQPILERTCAPCHTTGKSGDTSFGSNYEDNLAESETCSGQTIGQCNIDLIEDGTMPFTKFCGGPVADDAVNANECVTSSELDALKAWVAEGMPE